MLKTTFVFAVAFVCVSTDIGERKGVTISIPGEGTDLMLATEEGLGSFYCDNTAAASCEYVFTTVKGPNTIWDIIPYKEGEEDCYKIVKASGYSAGQTMTARNAWKWASIFEDDKPKLLTSDPLNPESKCWQFDSVGGDNFKIKKKLKDAAGMFIRARPINFKEDSVPKTRRFCSVSDDDTFNVWTIKNA